jgi:hypothetical protein
MVSGDFDDCVDNALTISACKLKVVHGVKSHLSRREILKLDVSRTFA